jgi:hypothetical protein
MPQHALAQQPIIPIHPAHQAHGMVQGHQDQGVPHGAPPAQVRGQATGVLPAEVVERARRQTHPPYGNPHIYPEYSGQQPNPHLPHAQFFAGSAGNTFAFGSAMNAERPAHAAVPVDDADRGSSTRGNNQNDYAFNERQR